MHQFFLCFLLIFITGPFFEPSWAEEPALLTDLPSYLREVIERNPEITAARAKAQAARERIPQSTAFEDPQVGLIQWSIPSNFNITKANETLVTYSQDLPFFGKRAQRGRVAQVEADLAEAEMLGVKRQVVSLAKKAYYDLFLSHRVLETHHEQVELAKRFSKIARERFSVGQTGPQDLLRAEVALLDLSNMIATLDQERGLAVERLAAFLGPPNLSPPAVPPTPKLPDMPKLDPNFERLRQQAERSSPKAQIYEIAARRLREESILAGFSYAPDFMAEVAYWQVHDGPNQWMTSLKLTLPWLNKEKYQSRLREVKAQEEVAQADYETALNEVRLLIRGLVAKYQASRRLAALYQEGILPLARQSLELAVIGYQTKKNDFLTLIAAQKDLKEYELTYYRALVDIQKGLAELEAVTGKDMEVDYEK